MGDNCHKVISQPRFVSFNSENSEFLNYEAKRCHLLEPERIYSIPKTTLTKYIPKIENPFNWCVEQINKNQSFTDNNRHKYIFSLAR